MNHRRQPHALSRAVHAPAPRPQLWVGVLAILGVLSTLLLLFTLTSPAMLRGRYSINGMIADAEGIRRGDPVQMRGVNIGRIKGFKIGKRRRGHGAGD